MFWLVMLVVAGFPCGVVAGLASFRRTSSLAVWLWSLGMVVFGWLAGSIIRGGVDQPAPTEDMQMRISLVMGIWIVAFMVLLMVFVATTLLLWAVPRTRQVGRKTFRALTLLPLGAVGGYLLHVPRL
jgi:uncharacterized membrane protein YeiB